MEINQGSIGEDAVVSVTASSPLFSSGGQTPNLTIQVANISQNGYLSSTDWNTFNGKESALTFSTGLTRTANTVTADISTGVAGGQTIYGGTAANDDLVIEGTSNGTKTTSYVILQPGVGNVGIGTSAPDSKLMVSGTAGTDILKVVDSSTHRQTLTGRKIEHFFSTEISPRSGWGDGYIGAGRDGMAFNSSGAITMAANGVGMDSPTSRVLAFYTSNGTTLATERMRIDSGGRVGIGLTPAAVLNIKAGTATAGTAPLKFTSGTLNTAAEAGAMEFLTDDFFLTITTGAARKGIILDDGARLTSGRIPFATTNGRLIDDADLTFATDTLTATKIVGTTSVKVGAVAGYISSDGSTGATGTFTTADAKTVTVKDGIITNIV